MSRIGTIGAVFASVAFMLPTAAGALSITPGGMLTNVAVSGQASIYGVFGLNGAPGGGGTFLPAVQIDFGAGAGRVFTFGATGLINCCNGTPDVGPDGGANPMSVGGANGLSSLSGSGNIPLVAVFTSETDPSLSGAPAALSFDRFNPLSLSPLLKQVFYVGDGRAGYQNAAGAVLTFTAPTDATRLYLGTIDALGFNNVTGFYQDNPGSFSVDVSLARIANPIPEPASWALMIAGFGMAGAALRLRVRSRAAA